jgi:hypothetical protein
MNLSNIFVRLTRVRALWIAVSLISVQPAALACSEIKFDPTTGIPIAQPDLAEAFAELTALPPSKAARDDRITQDGPERHDG